MKKSLLVPLLVLTVGLAFARQVCAELSLPGVFGEHMVLQRERPIPVWGWAAPGSIVQVKLADYGTSATADASGKWRVNLPAMKAGGPHKFTVAAEETIEFNDVLVGDVWLCSGQSNMDQNYPGVLGNSPETVRSQIRLLRVGRRTAASPEPDISDGRWTPCTGEFANAFSCVSVYFALELQPKIDVPIGLIDSSFGATSAEEWTSREVQIANPELKSSSSRPIDNDVLDKQVKEAAQRCRAYLPEAKAWKRAYEKALAEGKPMPLPPIPPADPRAARDNSGVFYNGMIAPLAPYAIRGVLWYQGEWNTGPGGPKKYRTLFPVLIESWRKLWGQGDFPFLYVQLPTFITNDDNNNWAALREAQTMALRVPNTAMAVTMDNPDPANLHPWIKPDTGKRLGLNALSLVYGQNVVCGGPQFASASIEGNKMRIRFSSIGGGLITKNNEPVKGFALAGKDRVFVLAHATIENESVVIWADSVSEPVEARYAWADAPACNLFNKEGLPAWPFRTDNWDDVTAWPKEEK